MFAHRLLEDPLQLIRGRTSAGQKRVETFTWTAGVQALCLFFARSLAVAAVAEELECSEAALSGETGTPAASLDYALSRQSNWLMDMFGCDASGTVLARRFIHRVNPERKRPGPVELRLNTGFLPFAAVSLYVGERKLSEPQELLALAEKISAAFGKKKGRVGQPSAGRAPTEAEQEPVSLPSDAEYPWPFHEQQNRFALVRILEQELSEILQRVNIFSRRHLDRTLEALCDDAVFKEYAGECRGFFERSRASLRPAELFGQTDEHLAEQLASPSGAPIKVCMPAGTTGPLVLVYYLKYFKKLPIEPQFRFVHAGSVLERLLAGTNDEENEISVLSAGHLTHLLRSSLSGKFGTVLLMPPNSFQVVSQNKANGRRRKSRIEELAVLGGLTSSSLLYAEQLKAYGHPLGSNVQVRLVDPDEVTTAVLPGNDVQRVVQWFPYYRFSQLLCGAQLLDTSQSGLNLKGNFAVASEAFLRQLSRRAAFETAIRDAWLTLLESPALLRMVLQQMCEEPDYLRFLTRSSGLSQLRTLSSGALESVDLSTRLSLLPR